MIYFINDYNKKIDAATARKYIDKEELRQVNIMDMYPENIIPLNDLFDHVNIIVRRNHQDTEGSKTAGFSGNYVIVSDSQLIFEYLRFLFMSDRFSADEISFVFSEDGNLTIQTMDKKGNFPTEFHRNFSFVMNEDAQMAYLTSSNLFEKHEEEL